MTVSEARAFAVAAHAAQRYGEQPYAVHLDAVAALVVPYGEVAQLIAYLHDVVEDTEVGLELVAERFGQAVADGVALLTDEPGADRRERKGKTYAKLAAVSGPGELALLVKAADRLANVRACVAGGRADLLRTYRDEHPLFRVSAHRPGLCDAIWSELDALVSGTP